MGIFSTLLIIHFTGLHLYWLVEVALFSASISSGTGILGPDLRDRKAKFAVCLRETVLNIGLCDMGNDVIFSNLEFKSKNLQNYFSKSLLLADFKKIWS